MTWLILKWCLLHVVEFSILRVTSYQVFCKTKILYSSASQNTSFWYFSYPYFCLLFLDYCVAHNLHHYAAQQSLSNYYPTSNWTFVALHYIVFKVHSQFCNCNPGSPNLGFTITQLALLCQPVDFSLRQVKIFLLSSGFLSHRCTRLFTWYYCVFTRYPANVHRQTVFLCSLPSVFCSLVCLSHCVRLF